MIDVATILPSSEWKLFEKPAFEFCSAYERDNAIYEHKQSGRFAAVLTERNRTTRINEDGEFEVTIDDQVVAINEVDMVKHRLGRSWVIVEKMA